MLCNVPNRLLPSAPMDYQTFNGGQPQPSFGFQSSAHSPQPTLPPQQAAFQQSSQAFPYPGQQFASNGQAFAASAAGMGGAHQMQQPMPPAAAGGMPRGERVTCAICSRPIVSCCQSAPTPSLPSRCPRAVAVLC